MVWGKGNTSKGNGTLMRLHYFMQTCKKATTVAVTQGTAESSVSNDKSESFFFFLISEQNTNQRNFLHIPLRLTMKMLIKMK